MKRREKIKLVRDCLRELEHWRLWKDAAEGMLTIYEGEPSTLACLEEAIEGIADTEKQLAEALKLFR
jgi:hypothetical protein